MNHSLLIVDDDEAFVEVLGEYLQSIGHPVDIATSGARAVELFLARRPALVISDLIMPEIDGASLIEQLREIAPELTVIAMTGGDRTTLASTLQRIEQIGVNAILYKPFGLDELDALIETHLKTPG